MTDEKVHLGARRRRVGSVDDAYAAVDLLDPAAKEAPLDVTAYAFDDEEGQVELTIGEEVSVEIVLAPERARQLAETIATAAADAEEEP